MKKALILLVMAIAFILVASSCTKEETISANYDRLSVGILEVNTVYMINGMTKITFGTPSDAPSGTTITLSAGENRMDGRNITATPGNPQELIVETNWKFIKFASQKTSTVEIISIQE